MGKHKETLASIIYSCCLALKLQGYYCSHLFCHHPWEKTKKLQYWEMLSGAEVSRLLLVPLMLPPSMGKHKETSVLRDAVWRWSFKAIIAPAYVSTTHRKTQRNYSTERCCLALKFQGYYCSCLCRQHPWENTKKLLATVAVWRWSFKAVYSVPACVATIHGTTQRNFCIFSCCLALRFWGLFCPCLCHHHPWKNSNFSIYLTDNSSHFFSFCL